MTGMPIDLGNGSFAIVWTRARRARALCSACKDREHELLCDHPLTGKLVGRTCSAKLCRRCANHIDGKDLCPPHAKVHGRNPPSPRAASSPGAAVVVGFVAHAYVACCHGIGASREEAAQELVYALPYAAALEEAGLQAPRDPIAYERCIRLDSEHWLACARAELGGTRRP